MMPWLFIPALLLTSVRWYLGYSTVPGQNFDSLFLPLAAWLGFRYGGKGLAAVGIAGAVLTLRYVPGWPVPGYLIFHLSDNLPLAGIGLAWLCSNPENWQRLRLFLSTHANAIWLLVLMPVGLLFQFQTMNSASMYAPSSVGIGGGSTVLAAIFVFGFLGGQFRKLFAPLAVTLILVMMVSVIQVYHIEYFLQNRPKFFFSYSFTTNLFDIGFLFFAGAWTAHHLAFRTPPFEKIRFGLPVLLAAVTLSAYTQLYLYKTYDIGSFFKLSQNFHPSGSLNIYLSGSLVAVTIASFLAGLVYGKRGFLFIMVPAACLSIVFEYFSFFLADGVAIFNALGLTWIIQDHNMLWSLPSLFAWVFAGDKTRQLYDQRYQDGP